MIRRSCIFVACHLSLSHVLIFTAFSSQFAFCEWWWLMRLRFGGLLSLMKLLKPIWFAPIVVSVSDFTFTQTLPANPSWRVRTSYSFAEFHPLSCTSVRGYISTSIWIQPFRTRNSGPSNSHPPSKPFWVTVSWGQMRCRHPAGTAYLPFLGIANQLRVLYQPIRVMPRNGTCPVVDITVRPRQWPCRDCRACHLELLMLCLSNNNNNNYTSNFNRNNKN